MTKAVHVMKLALFLLFLAGAALGKAPNIILVITDDQGYAPVGAHGHPWLKTPNMDKLRAAGTALDRFLVSPTCSPTRSTLMTRRSISTKSVAHIDVFPTLCGIPEK